VKPEEPTVARGIYGVKLDGFREPELLVPISDGYEWPVVRVARDSEACDGPSRMDDREALIRIVGGSCVRLDRRQGSASLFVAPEETEATLDHAFLSMLGACFARWRGDDSFHAGGFVADGGAWALVGERLAGKSSLLALLEMRGHDVLTDDLVVVSDGAVLAGPRCVDLRPSAGDRLGLRERTQDARGEERRRLMLGPVEPEVPFRGWIFLSWGVDLELRPLRGQERLQRLFAARMLSQPGTEPGQLLELSAYPAWELRRPLRWESLLAAADRLLDVVAR
jgi:hypothetical protein